MVAYHFAWDLNHFGVIAADVSAEFGWRLFAKAIAASFLAIAGVGLALATQEGIRWPAVLKRLALIGGAALLVTAVTWVTFPSRFIYFGILHCIAVSSLLALAFIRLPAGVTAVAGLAVILLPNVVESSLFNHPALVWIGFASVVPPSNDFEPIFPWFGWMLLGLGLARSGLLPQGGGQPGLFARLGRWSLVIYLVHQPILFNLVGAAVAWGFL